MKILEELWYGNVAPSERSVDKGSPMWELGRLIVRNEEELIQRIRNCAGIKDE